MKCEMWLCKPARREAGVSIMVHEAVTPPSPIVDMRAHDVLVRSSLSFSHQIVLGQLKIRDTGWHSKPPYQPTGCSMGMCRKLVQRSLFSYPLPIYFAAPSFSGMATTGQGPPSHHLASQTEEPHPLWLFANSTTTAAECQAWLLVDGIGTFLRLNFLYFQQHL